LETFFGTDLSRVDVQVGATAAFVTNVARGTEGVNNRRYGLLISKGRRAIQKSFIGGVGLIGHEAAHTFDYERLGVTFFLDEYIGIDGFYNFKKSESIEAAYSNISFEVAASEIEKLILRFLDGHPGIAGKIQRGASFCAG
jgi:hypothetical protein